jgi:hypothetical protein
MREAVSTELPDSSADLSWSTSVNLAHLHPGFEDRTILPKTKEDFDNLSPEEQEEVRAGSKRTTGDENTQIQTLKPLNPKPDPLPPSRAGPSCRSSRGSGAVPHV